jgi:hypothetical protein
MTLAANGRKRYDHAPLPTIRDALGGASGVEVEPLLQG